MKYLYIITLLIILGAAGVRAQAPDPTDPASLPYDHCPQDHDRSGIVGASDLAWVTSAWGISVIDCTDPDPWMCDYYQLSMGLDANGDNITPFKVDNNRDGVVGAADLGAIGTYWGQRCVNNATFVPVAPAVAYGACPGGVWQWRDVTKRVIAEPHGSFGCYTYHPALAFFPDSEGHGKLEVFCSSTEEVWGYRDGFDQYDGRYTPSDPTGVGFPGTFLDMSHLITGGQRFGHIGVYPQVPEANNIWCSGARIEGLQLPPFDVNDIWVCDENNENCSPY